MQRRCRWDAEGRRRGKGWRRSVVVRSQSSNSELGSPTREGGKSRSRRGMQGGDFACITWKRLHSRRLVLSSHKAHVKGVVEGDEVAVSRNPPEWKVHCFCSNLLVLPVT